MRAARVTSLVTAAAAAGAVLVALAAQPACVLFDRCNGEEASVQDAVLDKAEKDLSCERADIATGVGSPGADTPTTGRAQGCGHTATYDCSHNDCGWSCTLRGSVM